MGLHSSVGRVLQHLTNAEATAMITSPFHLYFCSSNQSSFHSKGVATGDSKLEDRPNQFLNSENLLTQLFNFTMCSSRKYPYPPMEGIFPLTPHPLWIFQNQLTQWTPPTLRKFHFCRTPPGNIITPCGNQR